MNIDEALQFAARYPKNSPVPYQQAMVILADEVKRLERLATHDVGCVLPRDHQGRCFRG